ncbi:AcrB/AcrD/AcrF family protein [Sphingosinithalassobacter portus]|uniref:AcrB/AcrD/AcrF family protein n=1 Tax=Stakelama portus TaxID=2676234 RepID=UPI001EFCC00C|nr:AcrB/AcrD/AcrF family protein [Sphingosinithalassobacter portus]
MQHLPSGALRLRDDFDRHWIRWALLAWLLIAAWFLFDRWGQIYWLALGDTDDNMRLMQVRALLNGQGWYDLRQYRLDPPAGFNIHWSRLVDLPIAGLILLLQPIVGTAMAEKLACGIAPMLPMAVAITALSLAVRRLVAPLAWPVTIVLMLGCTSTMLMFAPLRIDHHGWQLAFLAVTVAGMADPRRGRGGATVGLSSALSLIIGLELLPYCAAAGAIVTLRWVWDAAEARRLRTYGLTLGGGCALGFAIFGSYDNMAMRCDALTPVWLSAMVVAGALLFAMSLPRVERRWLRLVIAGVAGAFIAAAFASVFPQCVGGRLEGVSPELERVWLNNVREARPIFKVPLRNALPISVLPAIGLIGALIAFWRARRSPAAVGWAAVMLFTLFASAMLLWQIRAGPAAQMLSLPGATALLWILVPWFLRQRWMLVRVAGVFVAFMIISGLFVAYVINWLPINLPSGRSPVVAKANSNCQRFWAMKPLDKLPAATMFTQVDLGPRLITLTHHDAVAGPYHRNGQAILDVHHAFTGKPEDFRPIAARHHAQYVLLCVNMAETTVYRARNPNGFYAQLARGQVPNWLKPVDLPENSPFKLWRIDYGSQSERSRVGGQ